MCVFNIGKLIVLRIRHCFTNDQQIMIRQGRMLFEYVTMNAIAIWKVHSSVNGKNFWSKLRDEHIELLNSPWLIELGAFYINFNGSNGVSVEFVDQFSCDLESDHPSMTLMVLDSMKLRVLVNPYALSCGHIFENHVGVYANPIHMIELDLLLKKTEALIFTKTLRHYRRRDYWKERMLFEMVKQSKEYWGRR
ncbi:hypothetical protein MKX03_001420 [Papaver bracteatum]|nr:hypothetical protein MKX03_001420 [Papaver bracteatum]